MSIGEPALVVEGLADRTQHGDVNIKSAEYKAPASLEAEVIAAQEKVNACGSRHGCRIP